MESTDNLIKPEIKIIEDKEYVWMCPGQAREILGYSPKHFNDEAKANSWGKKALGRNVFYYVPLEYYNERQEIINNTSNKVKKSMHVVTSPSNPSDDVLLLQEMFRELSSRYEAANNELSARGNAIQKWKDKADMVEILEERDKEKDLIIQEMRAELKLINEKLNKPWYKKLF